MLLFQLVGGQMFPARLEDSNGKRYGADGVEYFTLDQAAKRSGQSPEMLTQAWAKVLGDSVPATNIIGEPVGGQNKAEREILSLSEDERLQLLKEMHYGHLDDAQFALLVSTCRERGLSVWCRHLWARLSDDSGRKGFQLVTTIDAVRLLTDRTGRIAHVRGPVWCDKDMVWLEVWPHEDRPPFAAKYEVLVKGEPDYRASVARWKSYAPEVNELGEYVLPRYWEKMDDHALGKAAESLARRAACPDALAGLYVLEEMRQAGFTGDVKPQPRAARPMPTAPDAHKMIADDTGSPDDVPYLDSDEEFYAILADCGYADQTAVMKVMTKYRSVWPQIARNDKAKFAALVARAVRRERDQRNAG